MKALIITDKNKPLEADEVIRPVAGDGEAIVRVHAAALNHRDVWIQKGQYAGLKYPIVPGSDGAGVVVEVGPPGGGGGRDGGGAAWGDDGVVRSGGGGRAWEDTHWVGKEVIIDPSLDWGESVAYQDPGSFSILGLPEDGTFAEYVKVPIENLVEKPLGLSFEEAAALPLAGVTAYRALMTRAQVKAGEKVLITGIGGGVALFALQFAIAAGAEVVVTSGSTEKLDKAMAMGASGGANYTDKGWVETLKSLAGAFDVIIDGASGDGVNDLLDLAMPGGRVVFYGATRGNPANVVARRIFWKQLNVMGSTMGSPADFRSMVDFVGRHSIRPVIDTIFPFDQMRWMDDARQFGKIVLTLS